MSTTQKKFRTIYKNKALYLEVITMVLENKRKTASGFPDAA